MVTKADLSTREGIADTALALARHLQLGYKDYRGKLWTDHNFELLRSFCEDHLGLTAASDCFHRHRQDHPEDKNEFLWDFLAVTKQQGILLAAESEQDSHTTSSEKALPHDFEKLLYVFAPLRLLICKSKNEQHERLLIKRLTDYAEGCCLNFNPGAAFLLHFGAWGGETSGLHESRTYIWQSSGSPRKSVKPEPFQFILLE